MAEGLFRKKSLEKIKSPENMNDYVRVINPNVWLVLVGIIVLLAGVCIWGIFGKIETRIMAEAKAENGMVICQVDSEKIDSVKKGMTVRVGDVEGEIQKIDLNNSKIVSEIEIDDGIYSAEIITEQIKPISFVFN